MSDGSSVVRLTSDFSSRALVACALAGAVVASVGTASAQTVAAPAADEDANSGTQLAEIVVSARKREERLVDVPASIQAISADTIEQQRIQNVDSLYGKVPSLYFSANFLSPGRDYINLVIRGIGAQSAGVPAVGTYVDGVYQPSLGFDIGFLDLERVEVLEGPQGTLFGRNTEGGALSIVTRKPTQDFHAEFATGYDSFDTMDEKVDVSGGLTNDLAASFAVHYSHTDGYLKERGIQEELEQVAGHGVSSIPADDMATANARAALRWMPSDSKTEANFTIDFSENHGHEPLPGVPVPGLRDANGVLVGGDPYGIYSDFQDEAQDINWGTALTVDHDFGFAKFTSITGYRYLTSVSPFDFDGGIDYVGNYHDLRQKQDFASQEFRLAGSPSEALNWIAGLFGFEEHDNQYRSYDLETSPVFPGLDIYYQNQLIKRTGYAVFGQASWSPVSPLEITGGLRYSWEKAQSNFAVDYTIPNYPTPGENFYSAGNEAGSISFSNLSPTGSVRYKIQDNFSVYMRYAKGFKPGGYPSAPTVGTDIPYKAETSDNYEVGLKGEFFDRRLSASLSAYDIEIKNQQLSTVVIYDNLQFASVGNAGKSRSRGVELNLEAQPVAGLTLGLNGGYVDARYVQYVDDSGKNRAGERFPFTPQVTASATGDYEFRVAGGWTASVGSTFKYVGPILSGTGVDLDIQFPVPSYTQLDLRTGLKKDNWRFEGFVDNVTNEYIVTRIWNTFFWGIERPFQSVAPPRRYGVRMTYSF